jgi:pimeloyl-[acyl-carrier protein] synthase
VPVSEAAVAKRKPLSLLQTLNPEVLAAPEAFYRNLRESDPVYWDPYMHAWVVTRYADVVAALTHASSDRSPSQDHLEALGLSFFKPFADTMAQQILFIDGTYHARLRGLCSRAFSAQSIERLKANVQIVANELIDKVAAARRIEMIADFASPLPAIMTCRLMGVPVEDHAQIGRWVTDLAEVHGNFQHHPARVSEVLKSLDDFKNYLAAHMAELRSSPNDGLICAMMNAELNGTRLTDDEVIANTIMMIIGGHETTTNLIASGFLTLLRNPAALSQLRDRPEIVASAVEELLRFESPVQHTARIVPADMELGGKALVKGSKLVAVLAAANRDPSRFSSPDSLDLLRTDNRHLAFGCGAHVCMGAALARIESQIAFNTLLRRLANPALMDNKLEWRQNAGLRGLTRLDVTFDPVKSADL